MELLSAYPFVKGLIGFGLGYMIGYVLLNKVFYPMMDRYRNEQEKKISEAESRRVVEEERTGSLTDTKEKDQTRLDNGK